MIKNNSKTYFIRVGNGSAPSTFGTKVPNELGTLDVLRGYQGEDIEIQLPGSLTVYDIDWLAVWCIEYRHNFGHVIIPKDIDVPPALGQTKIAVSLCILLYSIYSQLFTNKLLNKFECIQFEA